MSDAPFEPLRFTFSAPAYPWKGVAGSVLIHAGKDPARARRWLELPSINLRTRSILTHFASHEGNPSLSHWAKYLQVWSSQEPGSKPYVTLPPAASVLARSLHANPGTMWQRIREQRDWNERTLEDARSLVKRLAEGARDLPFSAFYEWARLAQWVEQHPSSSESRLLPSVWTDALAQQCLRDKEFWDSRVDGDEEFFALQEWLTASSTEASPALETLLADYTHWLSVGRDSGPSSYSEPRGVRFDIRDWDALRDAWKRQNGGGPAFGRELHWLASENRLVPSIHDAHDEPLTMRKHMMDWLAEAERRGLVGCAERAENGAPWDSRYVLVETPEAPSASAVSASPREWTSEDYEHLVEIWSSKLGNRPVPIERVVRLISEDTALRVVLPKQRSHQNRMVRNLLDHPALVDGAIAIEHRYDPRQRRTVYYLLDKSTDQRHGVSDEPSDVQINQFYAGWYRAFGSNKVILRDIEERGEKEGWGLPLPPRTTVTQPHPLSHWLGKAAINPHGAYHVEKIATRNRVHYRLLRETAVLDQKPGAVTQATFTSRELDTAKITLVEQLKVKDPLSAYIRALSPWMTALHSLGRDPSFFQQYGIDAAVCKKMEELWPLLTAMMGA